MVQLSQTTRWEESAEHETGKYTKQRKVKRGKRKPSEVQDENSGTGANVGERGLDGE